MREISERAIDEARSHSVGFLRKAVRLAERNQGTKRHRGTRKQTRAAAARVAASRKDNR